MARTPDSRFDSWNIAEVDTDALLAYLREASHYAWSSDHPDLPVDKGAWRAAEERVEAELMRRRRAAKR